MVIAEISVFPLGTGSPSVSQYVAAAGRELEAQTPEGVYAAVARAQAAVFELGAERAYTVIKMDERRDMEDRSAEDMVRSVRREET